MMAISKADMKCVLGVASLLLLQSLQLAAARYFDIQESVKLVVKITRHGARTPVVYPTGDPNNEFWKDSPGQLTNEGKVQLYEIGKSFRLSYKGLLNEYYKPEEIIALSTDVDRTIMSCQAFLAGLYPPKDYQVWNPKINWQPIPVHILDYDLDGIGVDTTKAMFEHCQDGTENDVFFSQHKHFYNRTLPYGLDPYYEDIEKLKNDFMVRMFASPVMYSRYNGPLYEYLISILNAKADNVLTQNAISICMHDASVLALWASLADDYPLTSPPFAASVVIELIKTKYNGQESFKVKMYTIPSPGAPRQILQIKGCGQRCFLDEFLEQLRIASIPQSTSVCPCSQN